MRDCTPLIALTTDFGSGSPYVAQMKGVLLSALPEARLVDVTHDIPAHSIRHAEIVLRASAFAFPLGAVHVVVIDPGVGTDRRPIAVQAAGVTFVGPDNGVLGVAIKQKSAVAVVLDRPEFFRAPLTSTFHGRDLFAPVAAELAAGMPLTEVGSVIGDARASTLPEPIVDGDTVRGITLVADTFGNLMTNIPADLCGPAPEVRVAGRRARWARTYGDAEQGELLALSGSEGFIELALPRQSAARELAGGVDLEVECIRTAARASS